MLARTALKVAVVLLLGLGSVSAADLTTVQRHAVIDDVARLVAKNYVFPQKRDAIVAKLHAAEAAGRYDVVEPAKFADLVTEDLFAASNDKHLYMGFDPARSESLKKPLNADQSNAFYEAEGLRRNQGYEEMRILPGNIRYVRLTGFHWNGAVTRQTIADAARFMAGGDAIIIDERGNGGGSAEAVQALVSYFLPPDNRILMTFHDPAGVSSTRVLPKLSAPRLVGKPLYVLIDGSTASAAEEFAAHVSLFKLGTLVGHTTTGGANNNDVYPVDPGFVLSVSTGSPVHPVSNGNWEGVGVAPAVAVDASQALDVAMELALKDRIANSPAERQDAYRWALAGVLAKTHPVTLDAKALAAYAGQYGVRKIWADKGVLMFQREDRAPVVLTPLADDLFAFSNSDDVRARFRRVGNKITGFDMITADGQTISVDRNS